MNAQPIYLTQQIRRIESLAANQPHPPNGHGGFTISNNENSEAPCSFPSPLALLPEGEGEKVGVTRRDSHIKLMERAGLAVAEYAHKLMSDRGKDILILAGPGNNGGDAFEAAYHLKHKFYRVTVVFIGEKNKLSVDARTAYDKWQNEDGNTLEQIPNRHWDLIIDGLFGIGLQRDMTVPYIQLIESVNALSTKKLAIDLPSGLNADTGQVMGKAIRADYTLTFFGLKPGLITLDGPDYAGKVIVDDLQLDIPALLPAKNWVIDKSLFAASLKPRPKNCHKGMMGNVGIIGGAQGMIGAGLLAGRAALKLGAGRVYLGLLADAAPWVDYGQAELMLRQSDWLLDSDHANCVAIGPGLGQSAQALDILKRALTTHLSLILDADALNLIALYQDLQEMLMKRKAPAIITPHAAEAARLLRQPTAQIQKDRIKTALDLANHYQCFTLLKGTGSIVAYPDGQWFINTTGNPGMASAGMGDVLSGIIAALIAQGWPIEQALLAGVHLHGAAADECIKQEIGPVGLTACETIEPARRIFNQWVKDGIED